MHQSDINIQITLDEEKMPETIRWQAPDGGVEGWQEAKGMLLNLWDGQEKHALRICTIRVNHGPGLCVARASPARRRTMQYPSCAIVACRARRQS